MSRISDITFKFDFFFIQETRTDAASSPVTAIFLDEDKDYSALFVYISITVKVAADSTHALKDIQVIGTSKMSEYNINVVI